MFTIQEKKIFKYQVRTKQGVKTKAVDPLKIQTSLATHDLDKDIIVLMIAGKEGGPEGSVGLEAMARLIKAARQVFKVEDYSEDEDVAVGLLDQEVLELLVDFGSFMQSLKNEQSQPPTLPSFTVVKSSAGENDNRIIKTSLDSTFVGNEA